MVLSLKSLTFWGSLTHCGFFSIKSSILSNEHLLLCTSTNYKNKTPHLDHALDFGMITKCRAEESWNLKQLLLKLGWMHLCVFRLQTGRNAVAAYVCIVHNKRIRQRALVFVTHFIKSDANTQKFTINYFMIKEKVIKNHI